MSSVNESSKPRTVIFLLKDDKVLLGYKKRGFGKGYYVGIGGKVDSHEAIEDAAIRELDEEIAIQADSNDLKKVGIVRFKFPHVLDNSWNFDVHVFTLHNWINEPVESDEIKPKWFEIKKLPLSEMWDDAQYWLPQILKGEKINKEFIFNENLLVIEQKTLK